MCFSIPLWNLSWCKTFHLKDITMPVHLHKTWTLLPVPAESESSGVSPRHGTETWLSPWTATFHFLIFLSMRLCGVSSSPKE